MMLVDGRPILTAKFEKEVGYTREGNSTTTVEVVSEPITSPTDSGEAMKRVTDLKLLWNTFITDSEIPHRVKTTDGGSYTIRQYGAAVARKLQKIIQDPKIDYWRLVEATKHYYKVTSYKHLLSNYISKDIWFHEYNNWSVSKQQDQVSDGSSRWESE